MSATVEDLLKLLEEPDESPVSSLSDSKIKDFINEFKITSGVDRVDNSMLWYTYKKVYGGELSKIEFFRQFKKQFIQVRTGKKRSYMLDKRSFDYSREGLIEAEFFAKENK
tara:strand:- start:672 stop:1004 length:333 start_codon:yes stop_codon:yes gene_type:complete